MTDNEDEPGQTSKTSNFKRHAQTPQSRAGMFIDPDLVHPYSLSLSFVVVRSTINRYRSRRRGCNTDRFIFTPQSPVLISHRASKRTVTYLSFITFFTLLLKVLAFSMAEPLDSQNSILIQSTSFFSKVRVMIRHAWALRDVESPLYTLYGHILTAFCETGGDTLEVDRALGCEPQSSFSTPTEKEFDRRIPDFTIMLTFLHDPAVFNRFSPLYRHPVLGFWVEIKTFTFPGKWMSDEGQQAARRAMWVHIQQLNEQATFAFTQFAGDKLYGMLILGIYFSVFEYLRPTRLPPPTHPLPPSVLHQPPSDSNQSRKRPKRKRGDDVKAQTNAKRGMERMVLNLSVNKPTALYYSEPILSEDGEAFSPLFRKALWDIITSREIDIPFQPSFFTPPPGDHHASEISLESARQDLDDFLDRQDEQVEDLRDAADFTASSEEDTSGNYYSSVRPSNAGANRRTRSQSRGDDALSEGDLDVPSFEDTDDAHDNAQSNIEDDIPLDFDFDLGRGVDDEDDENDDEAENDEDDEAENVSQYSHGTRTRGRESTR
ncbi:hypothetical protein BKA93DRAFT_124710 [Sparassis latifolia]